MSIIYLRQKFNFNRHPFILHFQEKKKMDSFNQIVAEQAKILANKPTWSAISAENVAKMKIQNRFKTGTEIAKYCSEIMRKDIAEFEADDTKYTQSLGCWHG